MFQKENLNLSSQPNLPNNFLAEKIILSNLLISSEAVEITLRTLKVESFYFKNHQEIFKAIIILYQNKIPIDIVTLNSFLQEHGLLEKIGGVKVLIDLINEVPNLVYLEEHIRLVKDKFLRRSLIKLGYKIINSGYITNLPLENILNDLEEELFNLTNQIRVKKISTSLELLTNIFIELKEKSLNPNLSGIESGFYDLDSITQGFQNSDLIIIAGRPSMGKTALCLNIATNIIKNTNLPVLFFSLEMAKNQLIYRLISTEAKINQMKLKTGSLNQKDWVNLNKVIKNFSNSLFFIDDTSSLSIQDIRSKVKKIIFEQNKLGLLIIDYLQLMEYSTLKTENRTQELSYITRSLKNIAREFNIPIIALSQLSRKVESRINKRPFLSDLRESGSIEQDADLVLMLYREEYYNTNFQGATTEQICELIIAKHRNGPTGTIQLNFNEELTQFSNLT